MNCVHVNQIPHLFIRQIRLLHDLVMDLAADLGPVERPVGLAPLATRPLSLSHQVEG